MVRLKILLVMGALCLSCSAVSAHEYIHDFYISPYGWGYSYGYHPYYGYYRYDRGYRVPPRYYYDPYYSPYYGYGWNPYVPKHPSKNWKYRKGGYHGWYHNKR